MFRGSGEIKLVVQLKEVPTAGAIGKDSLHILDVVNADKQGRVRTLKLVGRDPDRLKRRDG